LFSHGTNRTSRRTPAHGYHFAGEGKNNNLNTGQENAEVHSIVYSALWRIEFCEVLSFHNKYIVLPIDVVRTFSTASKDVGHAL
jgi:heme/copper-type cytochrome/quinol oxidase subunit 2